MYADHSSPVDSVFRPRVAAFRASMLAAFWLVVGTLFTLQAYYYRINSGQFIGWWPLWLSEAVYFGAWALLTPLVLECARTFRVERATWKSRLLLHLMLAVALAMFQRVVYAVAMYMVTPHAPPLSLALMWDSVIGYFDYGVYIYLLIVFVEHAFEYYNRLQREELRSVALRSQLAAAQLEALRSQLNPHFLFNTLNSISVLIADEPARATAMLEDLSDLLRMTLDHATKAEISLHEELVFLDRYLTIEQTRFGDRLTIKRDIHDDALEAAVPTLLLQPLVENALRHGIGRVPGPGSVFILAERRNGAVYIRIRDTGPGLTANGEKAGVGLSTTRARLEQMYGGAQRCELANADGGGSEVVVQFPFHPVHNRS